MKLKIKHIIRGLIATLLLAFAVTGCESFNEELLDGIGNTREFSPTAITAIIRNQTTVELNWTAKEEVDHYVVEFSADDPEFKTIYKTVNVAPTELPVKVALEGETVYSIRIKAVTSGLEDSKWTVTTATTLTEQIFLPVQDADIEAKEVTLRWTPNSSVTQISVMPGNMVHTITPAEKTAGVATITGLTGETAYTATLLNGTKKRGVVNFTTGIDIGTGILIKPEDDLNAKITEAASGAVLVLMPGDYQVFKGEIIVNKSITIRGLRPGDKPKLHVKFSLNPGVANFSLIDLDLDGTGMENAAVITILGAASNYGDILISNSKVHDFTRALMAANITSAKVTSFTVDNTIVKNVNTNAGADFIDFRNTYVASIVLKNSTFDTCSANRDFVRVDAATGLTGTGLTTSVSIDACTIFNRSMLATNRIVYVRFASNVINVRNTLFETPLAIYTNQTSTSAPTFSNNNYFNSTGLHNTGATGVKFDASGTFTTLDPQFVNATSGDFTVKNQTLIDKQVGDPRWRQ